MDGFLEARELKMEQYPDTAKSNRSAALRGLQLLAYPFSVDFRQLTEIGGRRAYQTLLQIRCFGYAAGCVFL